MVGASVVVVVVVGASVVVVVVVGASVVVVVVAVVGFSSEPRRSATFDTVTICSLIFTKPLSGYEVVIVKSADSTPSASVNTTLKSSPVAVVLSIEDLTPE